MRAAGDCAQQLLLPASAGICAGVDLLKRLDQIFTNDPVYGSRRLQVALLREGISVGRRRVRRLMRKLGLWAVRPKRNTSKRHPEHQVYPYLLRGRTIDQPNQSLPSRKRGCGQLT
jgi:transposase InsO family protein